MNQHDAVAVIKVARTAAQRLLGPVRLVEYLTDPDTGEFTPITLVTDNCSSFRALGFGALITVRPELHHVQTRVRSPGQDGVRERVFGSLRYVRLHREQIDDPFDLVRESDALRIVFNHSRPHEALCWSRPPDVRLGHGDPVALNVPNPKNPATFLTWDTATHQSVMPPPLGSSDDRKP